MHRDEKKTDTLMMHHVSTLNGVSSVLDHEELLRWHKHQIAWDHVPFGIACLDPQGRVESCNREFQRILSLPSQPDVGVCFFTTMNLTDDNLIPLSWHLVLNHLKQHDVFEHHTLVHVPQYDVQIRLSLTIHNVPKEFGLSGWVVMLRDLEKEDATDSNHHRDDLLKAKQVIAQKDQELALTRERHHLTGLIDRRTFERRLNTLVNGLNQNQHTHGLLYLDLDVFRVINDSCGYQAGDEMLISISRVIQSCLGDEDVLAHLGGDEFAVLLPKRSLDELIDAADHMCQSISEHRFIWYNKQYSVTTSMGLLLLDHQYHQQKNVLSYADTACHLAKREGGHRVYHYRDQDEKLAHTATQSQCVSEIHKALDEERFVLYCQKIMPLDPSRLRQEHIEVLIRMIDEHHNIIYPMDFLPTAEHYQLINKIDRWVIRHMFQLLAKRSDFLEQIGMCSINLSAQSLGDPKLVDFLKRQFERFQIPPEKICFEITETSVVADLISTIQFIEAIRMLGCQFSLDDFGCGMSSLAYLKNLPVDIIKIDGIFIQDMLSNPVSEVMVESIKQMGRVMGKKTVAEYVESEALIDKLTSIGVDYAQGFAIGRPIAVEDYITQTVR